MKHEHMKKSFLIAFLLVIGFSVQAQENYFYINWDLNMPLSNKDWMESTSAAGGKVGYRAFIGGEGKFSAGLDFNWATFDQYEPRETFQNSTGALTTDYFKYIYNYGVAASGQYYFLKGENDILFPYAGLGLGANYNEYVIYYNIYEEGDKSWGFLVRPEAGILVKFGARRSFGVMAAVHYDYSTNKTENFDYSNFSSAGFQLGIMVMAR
jgi:hypothetical protein